MGNVRFHISSDGKPRTCLAEPGDCPLGPDKKHYETIPEARAAYEEENSAKTLTALRKPKVTLTELEYLAKKEIAKYLPGWNFAWDDHSTRAGVCRYNQRKVSLSSRIALANTKEKFFNVLYHEIAHGIVGPGHGHDQIWTDKALEIGSDGKAQFLSQDENGSDPNKTILRKARWIGSCFCGWETKNGRNRLTEYDRNSLLCPRCNNKGEKRLLNWRENF